MKNSSLIVLVLMTATLLTILYMSNIFFEKAHSKVLPFGLKDNWVVYHKSHEEALKKQKIKSVKAVFYVKDKKTEELHYIVSLKKHEKAKSKKDGRYEFLGGKVDKREKLLEALARETAEEDPSLILAKRLSHIFNSEPEKLHYKLVTLKNDTTHAVFVIPLLETEWQKLDEFYQENDLESLETYGFEKLDLSYFTWKKEKNSTGLLRL